MIELIAFWVPIVLVWLVLLCIFLLSELHRNQKLKRKTYKRIPVTRSTKSKTLSQLERDRRVKPANLNQYKNSFTSTPAPNAKPLMVPNFFQKSNPLEPKLISLLNGDQKAAMRLVENLRIKYPDQSEQWIFEKSIHDLTRDRH